MKSAKMVLMPIMLIGCAFIFFCLYVWLIDYSTRISIRGGEKPTFMLSGSGRLADFSLLGPRQRPGNGRDSFTVWKLEPIAHPFEAEFVGIIGTIEYGSVPTGFRQIYPEQGPPPPLQSGEKYLLQVETINAPWGQLAFEIRDGKAIAIPLN